ncbi:MAG: hypothetical protein ACP5JU_00885 [Minisyncoccia bacterium]
MIQSFWQIDFLGIFLSRLIISIALFIFGFEKRKEDKVFTIFCIGSSILNFLGLLSSFVAIIWIIFLFLKFLIRRRFELFELALASYFIMIIFVGPGKLSVDRIFNLRW